MLSGLSNIQDGANIMSKNLQNRIPEGGAPMKFPKVLVHVHAFIQH